MLCQINPNVVMYINAPPFLLTMSVGCPASRGVGWQKTSNAVIVGRLLIAPFLY